MLPFSSTPWNPAITAISPASSASLIGWLSIETMRARENALSVTILHWWPRKLRALPPGARIASATRPTETCSPVEMMTSTSRSFGSSWSWRVELEQAVRLARHRRDDDGDLVPLALGREAAPRRRSSCGRSSRPRCRRTSGRSTRRGTLPHRGSRPLMAVDRRVFVRSRPRTRPPRSRERSSARACARA